MITTFDTWNNNVIEKLEMYCHDILNGGIHASKFTRI